MGTVNHGEMFELEGNMWGMKERGVCGKVENWGGMQTAKRVKSKGY